MHALTRDILTKKLRREVVVRGLFFLPAERRRRLERWLRGREEFRELRQADVAVVSCGKSGRTWLRAMVSRFFQVRYDLPGGTLINLDNPHYRHRDIPRILFTHDAYIQYYTGNFDTKYEYRSVRSLLLVRHPADVAASQFFQWKHRILPRKKWLNEYPAHGADVSMFDFVMDPHAGLPYIVEFLNRWGGERSLRTNLELVRYEDMLADPRGQLRRALRFLDFEATDEEVDECVSFASFENMRKVERQDVLWRGGRAMRAKDGDDPDRLKVRRGVAGGWRDYFSDEEAGEIERYIESHLRPGFGYLAGEAPGVASLGTPAPVRRVAAG